MTIFCLDVQPDSYFGLFCHAAVFSEFWYSTSSCLYHFGSFHGQTLLVPIRICMLIIKVSSYMNAKVTKLNAAKLTEIESHYLTLETVVDVTISPPQGPFSDCSESFYHITPCFPAHGI